MLELEPWLGVELGSDVEDWAEIRRLHFGEGVSIKELVRRTGHARNTVREALRSETPPAYERAAKGSAVDPFEPQIRELLRADPRMPATVIAERIGWSRGITILKDRVALLRPLFLPPDPVQRTEYRPGELAQWDLWFPPVDIPVGFGQARRLPVIVGVSGYSRMITARMIPSKETHDILGGHLWCLGQLGAVPRLGVYDNEPALISRKGGKGHPTEAFNAFRGVLGMGVIACKPGDPEAKGLVERANGYLETSFLPGRSFDSINDFNAQLRDWLTMRANQRIHATLRCRPIDRFAEDQAAMLALPPVLPDPTWRFGTRLPRDHHIRVDTCDYSVHPKAIGRLVEVRVDLDTVTARLGGELVADHVRSLARHRTITADDHVEARDLIRRQRDTPRPVEVEVEERDLSVYDKALGVAS